MDKAIQYTTSSKQTEHQKQFTSYEEHRDLGNIDLVKKDYAKALAEFEAAYQSNQDDPTLEQMIEALNRMTQTK